MPQHQWPNHKTRLPRRGREIQKEVCSGCVKKSKYKERLTIIQSPSTSLISGATESGGEDAILVQALSQLKLSDLALLDSRRQLAHDSTDSEESEYVNDHSQCEVDYDEEGEDVRIRTMRM